jgi:hypothetical protein
VPTIGPHALYTLTNSSLLINLQEVSGIYFWSFDQNRPNSFKAVEIIKRAPVEPIFTKGSIHHAPTRAINSVMLTSLR